MHLAVEVYKEYIYSLYSSQARAWLNYDIMVLSACLPKAVSERAECMITPVANYVSQKTKVPILLKSFAISWVHRNRDYISRCELLNSVTILL